MFLDPKNLSMWRLTCRIGDLKLLECKTALLSNAFVMDIARVCASQNPVWPYSFACVMLISARECWKDDFPSMIR